ncbi:hypothetical protein [Paenibacillus methanolicus]|uniref:YceG-like family protein n=1 Tax=Paenibacillus methanolicus TaxID=582686 RepID=A0A5S5CE17_9BACL|nr:hypothetical protein [Paenibacillus methanolicus]TYP77625.1 hypothetical protein BCM02_102186 [Paenibacillus methanolicus]
MSKRSFLTGLGTGVIIGAVLLQLFLIGQGHDSGSADPLAAGDTYTQEEVDLMLEDERAKVKAEIAEQEKAAANAQKKPTAGTTQTPANTTTPAAGQKPAAATGSTANTGSAAGTAGQKQTTSPIYEGANGRTIIRILPGKGVQDAANLLFESEIITDKKALLTLMKGKTVRAGYFGFSGNLTLKQVRDILTSTPISAKKAEAEIAARKANASAKTVNNS